MQQKESTVYAVTARIISKIYGQIELSAGKALLAKLRRTAGTGGQLPVEVMAVIIEDFPEEYLGKGKELSYQEAAVLAALQMYAIYQQGKKECAHRVCEPYFNMGSSLRSLRIPGESASIDRRFNAMITSDTFDEFVTHLRYMIQLLKSKAEYAVVDFAGLAKSLYQFQLSTDGQNEVRLKWSREFYKMVNDSKGDKKDE